MSVRPAAAPALPTPAEMERMVAQAGLTLNAGQMADLALAWRQTVGLLARIPRNRPLADDQAYAFRLPPPAPVAAARAAARSKAAAGAKTQAPSKPKPPATPPRPTKRARAPSKRT